MDENSVNQYNQLFSDFEGVDIFYDFLLIQKCDNSYGRRESDT